jgi:hypothetical protein
MRLWRGGATVWQPASLVAIPKRRPHTTLEAVLLVFNSNSLWRIHPSLLYSTTVVIMGPRQIVNGRNAHPSMDEDILDLQVQVRIK